MQLVGLIGVFALARLVLSLKSAKVRSSAEGATAVREYLDAFIVAGLVTLLLITFVVRVFYIPSGSMIPTLQVRDLLLVNELEYRIHPPHRGDIAVFRPPVASPNDFIKRVIAVPGDSLRITGGKVYVNGRPLVETYISAPPQYSLVVKNYGIYVDYGSGFERLNAAQADVPPRAMWQSANRVPQGFYFMMGDNRNDSEDSHIWGFAQLNGRFAAGPLAKSTVRAEFTGRAFLLMWPFKRLQILH